MQGRTAVFLNLPEARALIGAAASYQVLHDGRPINKNEEALADAIGSY